MGSISIATFESTDSEPCQDFGVKKKDRERQDFNQHAKQFVPNPSWGFVDTDIGKLDNFKDKDVSYNR